MPIPPFRCVCKRGRKAEEGVAGVHVVYTSQQLAASESQLLRIPVEYVVEMTDMPEFPCLTCMNLA